MERVWGLQKRQKGYLEKAKLGKEGMGSVRENSVYDRIG